MRDLTSQVAALRDAFGAAQGERSAARRESATALAAQLALHRRDRHSASLAWNRALARRAATHLPASAPRPLVERPAAATDPAHPPADAAAPAAETAPRPNRQRINAAPVDGKGER
jgi:hypothetical protein